MKIKHAAVDSVAALMRLIKDLLFASPQKNEHGHIFLDLGEAF